MPAAATVSDDEIRQAEAWLVATKRPVTGYALRTQVGHRGDPRRLMAVWEQMRNQAASPDQPPAFSAPLLVLPPDLTDKALAFAAEFQAVVATAWATGSVAPQSSLATK